MASVRSRPPGPTAVPGVFLTQSPKGVAHIAKACGLIIFSQPKIIHFITTVFQFIVTSLIYCKIIFFNLFQPQTNCKACLVSVLFTESIHTPCRQPISSKLRSIGYCFVRNSYTVSSHHVFYSHSETI